MRLHVFVMSDEMGVQVWQKTWQKENDIVQITDEDYKMTVGLGNRRPKPIGVNY